MQLYVNYCKKKIEIQRNIERMEASIKGKKRERFINCKAGRMLIRRVSWRVVRSFEASKAGDSETAKFKGLKLLEPRSVKTSGLANFVPPKPCILRCSFIRSQPTTSPVAGIPYFPKDKKFEYRGKPRHEFRSTKMIARMKIKYCEAIEELSGKASKS